MPKKLEELTGVFSRVRIRFDDDTIVGTLDDRTAVKGRSPETDDGLTPGMTYRFYGRWEEYHNKRLNQKQRQFSFRQYVKCEPHTRHGLVKYLQRYARGIGPARAGRMFDLYGSDAVKMLRTDPGRVVNDVKGLKVADAQAAAETLQGLAELEDTKIALWSLLAGRGFPANLADEVIQRWGILAPARIKRDPLSLLVENFAGCGWNRVDALYCELGHDRRGSSGRCSAPGTRCTAIRVATPGTRWPYWCTASTRTSPGPRSTPGGRSRSACGPAGWRSEKAGTAMVFRRAEEGGERSGVGREGERVDGVEAGGRDI